MFDAESYDTGGMYNAPDAFVTVPRTGTYLLTGAITFGDVSGASVQTRLVVNGTVVAITHSNASPAQITLPISKVLPLTAGDQVALGTFSSIGTATVINFSGTVPDAWLDVQMVSP
jgi:hypothetical protein